MSIYRCKEFEVSCFIEGTIPSGSSRKTQISTNRMQEYFGTTRFQALVIIRVRSRKTSYHHSPSSFPQLSVSSPATRREGMVVGRCLRLSSVEPSFLHHPFCHQFFHHFLDPFDERRRGTEALIWLPSRLSWAPGAGTDSQMRSKRERSAD